MDINNHVIKLCLAGTRAEFEGRIEDARKYYQQAWQDAQDDYEACIAAHYVARHQADPGDSLRLVQMGLSHNLKTIPYCKTLMNDSMVWQIKTHT